MRQAGTKPPRALVKLSVRRDGQRIIVSIGDDGPGVDWDAIALRARERGLPHASRSDLEAALFSDGISMRSETHRYLGPCRARRRAGGGSRAGRPHRDQTADGGGSVFHFVLPESMLVDDPGARGARPASKSGQPDAPTPGELSSPRGSCSRCRHGGRPRLPTRRARRTSRTSKDCSANRWSARCPSSPSAPARPRRCRPASPGRTCGATASRRSVRPSTSCHRRRQLGQPQRRRDRSARRPDHGRQGQPLPAAARRPHRQRAGARQRLLRQGATSRSRSSTTSRSSSGRLGDVRLERHARAHQRRHQAGA